MVVGWAAPPAAEAGNHDQNSKLERLGLSGPSRWGPAPTQAAARVLEPHWKAPSPSQARTQTLEPNLNRWTYSALGSESLARAGAAGLVKPATQTGSEERRSVALEVTVTGILYYYYLSNFSQATLTWGAGHPAGGTGKETTEILTGLPPSWRRATMPWHANLPTTWIWKPQAGPARAAAGACIAAGGVASDRLVTLIAGAATVTMSLRIVQNLLL